MSNPKSVESNIVVAGQVIGLVSTQGTTTLPPSAGVAVTATKTTSGKVTSVNGTVSGIVVDIPAGAK